MKTRRNSFSTSHFKSKTRKKVQKFESPHTYARKLLVPTDPKEVQSDMRRNGSSTAGAIVDWKNKLPCVAAKRFTNAEDQWLIYKTNEEMESTSWKHREDAATLLPIIQQHIRFDSATIFELWRHVEELGLDFLVPNSTLIEEIFE